jgi:hypothetical protein
MDLRASMSLVEHFSVLEDPRMDRTKLHSLTDILVIAICVVLCDMDSWADVAMFGKYKESWFRTFLKLPNGIPSHDTFGRVFSMLDPAGKEAGKKKVAVWCKAELPWPPGGRRTRAAVRGGKSDHHFAEEMTGGEITRSPGCGKSRTLSVTRTAE